MIAGIIRRIGWSILLGSGTLCHSETNRGEDEKANQKPPGEVEFEGQVGPLMDFCNLFLWIQEGLPGLQPCNSTINATGAAVSLSSSGGEGRGEEVLCRKLTFRFIMSKL
jgi:hypothetical protein